VKDKHDDLIDLARLHELLSAYGANPSRWPKLEREAAEALLESDPEARRAQREAAGLDAWLESSVPAAPSAALSRRVAEIPLRNPRRAQRWAFERLLPWRAVLAAALACTLGAVSGALSMEAGSSADGNDDGWDDVTAVTFALGLDEEP
jgi:hypothetical protein